MTSCSEFELIISQALDHELSDTEEEALKAHLEGCAECRALYDELKEIQLDTASLSVTPPEALHAQIMDRVQETSSSAVSDSTAHKSHSKWLFIAAVFCLILSASLFYKLHSFPGQDPLFSSTSEKKDAQTESSSEAIQGGNSESENLQTTDKQQNALPPSSSDQAKAQNPAPDSAAMTADEAEEVLRDYLNALHEYPIVIFYNGVSDNNIYYLFSYFDSSGRIWNYQVSSIDWIVLQLP